MEPTLISKKRKKRLRSNLPDSHDSSLYKSAEQTVSRGIKCHVKNLYYDKNELALAK